MSGARAVLAGASGFIGPRLAQDLRTRGYEVVVVGRRGPDVRWDDRAALDAAVDGADLVINLAGRSVGCRYRDSHRQEIYASRVDTTRALAEAVRRAGHPPRLWLNASTATIYRHAMDRPQTEDDGELGEGFSVDVARDWERTFFAGELPQTRRVALRMAIVLGDGPALNKLLAAARFGMGVLRQESELVLKSRWAVPRRLLDAGFTFRWPVLDDAVADLVPRRSTSSSTRGAQAGS